MSTLVELSYRTVDDLLNSVQTDFRDFAMDNFIEPAELIKIAQKCNWDLGLKLNKTKETILDIEHGRAKLPADFYAMNIAMLCNTTTAIQASIANGIQSRDIVTYGTTPNGANNVPNMTTCPCWTVEATKVTQASVLLCDGTTVTQTFNIGTTKVCAATITPYSVGMTFTTDSFCYNDINTGQFTCDAVPTATCGTCISSPVNNCAIVDADPWFQNRVYSVCDGTATVKVVQECQFSTYQYTDFAKLYLVPSKQATAFCLNTQFPDCFNRGQIRDGFIQMLPGNNRFYQQQSTVPVQGGYDNWGYPNSDQPCVGNGKVYICYEGVMEDDQGNLLVIDHPMLNEFYEWSVKERILANMYLNGEPDIERRLQYVKNEVKMAKIQAKCIIAMPDYRSMTLAIEDMRAASYNKYIGPFKRLYNTVAYNGWGTGSY